MTVFSLGVGVALLTAALGLSLALGAFLAGIMVSDSRFRHQAVADIIPLRDAFLAIFFVSIGMMLDASFAVQNSAWILAFSAVILLIKFFTTAIPGSLIGYAPGTAALVALSLAQIGEFSLVVAQEGRKLGLLTEHDMQMILSCTLVLFLVTPWVFRLAPKLAPQLAGLDPLQRLMRRRGIRPPAESTVKTTLKSLTDHVIIFGFGHNGEILAQTLERCAIPYIAVDLNPDNVVRAQKRGYPVIFGDGTRPEVLHAASLETARIAVVTVSDPRATLHVLRCVRSVCPEIQIIARATLARELEQLLIAPPTDVVVAEIEAGVEIVGRVLMNYERDPRIVQEEMDLLHSNNYQSIRAFVATQSADADKDGSNTI
jgi:CPA2 family monovalent cation:H+ antiporter-2